MVNNFCSWSDLSSFNSNVLKNKTLTFIDMFSGIGTIRMGFGQAGHKCVSSIEFDKHKRKIYEIIFEEEPEFSDITKVRGSQLPHANVWTFGAPCQDFSTAGRRSGLQGERSSLVGEVFRLLREIKEEYKPDLLLYENVKGMLSSNKGLDYLEILNQMDECGYNVEWQIINSKDYVPQNRERVYTIGHLRGQRTRKILPIKRESNEATCKQFSDGKGIAYCLEKGCGKPLSVKDKERRTQVIENCAFATPSRMTKNQNGKRLKGPDDPMFTLTTQDVHGVTDGVRIRRLTPRECWRLQGIPDEITNKVIEAGISDTQMYKAAGDACTVPVIYDIASRLEVLE